MTAPTTVALPPKKEATRPWANRERATGNNINTGDNLDNPAGDEAQSATVPRIIGTHWLRPEKTDMPLREDRVFAFCAWLGRAPLSSALSRRSGFSSFGDLTDAEVGLAVCVMARREELSAIQQGGARG